MLKVAIVILNWNGKEYLKKFLPGVLSHSLMDGVKVFVADNASTDGSVDFIAAEFPHAEIIELDSNYGFAEGYNRAFTKIQSEYFLLLNSDVEVTPGWLKPLIETMDANPLVAACAPKLLSFNQRNYFEYAGAAGGYIDAYGYAFCRGRMFDSLEADYGQHNTEAEVFWTTGACMLIRGPLYKIAGGLDPFFFAHYEEIDLCWRLKNRGYSLKSVPQSIVYHVGGGTLPPSNPRKTYLNFRNSLICLYKNSDDHQLVRKVFLRMAMDALSFFRFIFQGKFRDGLAIIQAHFSFYGNLGRFRRFRKTEKKFVTTRNHRQIYPKSIVFQYFIKKKYSFPALKWIP